MSEARPREREAAASAADDAIVARISAAVHAPFEEVWRSYEENEWVPVRRALEEAGRALEEAGAAYRRATGPLAGEARERYLHSVSHEVLEPIRSALAGSAAATALEESLARAAGRAKASLATLPVFLDAPAPRPRAVRISGVGPVRAVKRIFARVLGPLAWKRRARRVPVARLARQHLDQVVLRAQASAFRESQRDRAGWLGRFERAWADWVAAALDPPRDAGAAPHATRDAAGAGPAARQARVLAGSGETLRTELRALMEDITRASGRARGSDFGAMGELLAASVAVAGTLAADPPTSRPTAGRQRELARRWDAWAGGTAARLELYRGLVAMKRGTSGILRGLREGWSRAIRAEDAVLAEITAELGRGRERALNLSPQEDDLPRLLDAERERTHAALARLRDTLPGSGTLVDALTTAVDAAIQALDDVRGRLPGTLALHDIPEPGDPPRRPPGDPRAVRPRETFLQAFETLRRERIRRAPFTIGEALRRVRSEVAELREVAAYGYEAAIAELKDGRGSGSQHPTELVANGLALAAKKSVAARGLLHEALAAAEKQVADETSEGSRQLIGQVTADRVTAGYLEARTYLAAGSIRLWKLWRGRVVRAGARAGAAAAWVAGLLRRALAALGFGPAVRTAAGPHEHSLAYAEEYPRSLPVVYRRLFLFEPVTDERMLAGREDALAAVAKAWDRRAAGDTGSLIVISSPGAGVTSFLNVVASRLSAVAPEGVRRTFAERVGEEARLAASLGGWLRVGDADDLDSLADRVLMAPRGTVPPFAVLEATEHLHMRAPGGGRLIERLLTFVSRTEARVFWILAMTSPAWQLVRKRAPAFVHKLGRVVLDELSPDQLRQAIMARHRLSGLPLRFAEPRDGRAALRRRTRRLRGTDKQKRLIETDYFQQLHRASRGSVRLALFHWLRSADFATTRGSLLVQPLNPPSPGIGNLDRMQSFALKAIVDHGTLTADEYRRIARIPGPEASHILRSLEEGRVIAVIPRAETAEEPDAGSRPGLGREPRYRIRPLMTGAVAAHLRARNILH